MKEFESAGKLGLDVYKDELSELCKIIHSTVEDYGDKFYKELRRKTYTTPTSYL